MNLAGGSVVSLNIVPCDNINGGDGRGITFVQVSIAYNIVFLVFI